VEESAMHEPEMPEKEERELPGDADDSMEWLEELAADTGALWGDPPSEEDGTSNELAEESASENAPGWIETEPELAVQEGEPIPEWLIPHLETTELPEDAEESASPEVDSEQDTIVSAKIPTIPDSEVEEANGQQFAEDLSWLDRIASGEGTAIEELPTMRWDDDDSGSEERAADHEVSAAEQPEEVPEDADEAMAWLEQLATRQGAPAEELTMPDVSADIEIPQVGNAGDEVTFNTIPDDPDEAVAWLEQLSAQQGAPDEDLATAQEETHDLVEETAPTADDGLDLAMEELAGVAMPEDSDEALAWLEELADIEGAEPEIDLSEQEVEVVEEPPTPAVEHDVVAARAEAEILFARQQITEAVEEAPPPELDVAQSEELVPEVVQFDAAAEASADLADIEEQADSAVSGEYDEDEAEAAADEELDWLDSLGEEDAASWLESESVVSEVSASEADVVEDEGEERVSAYVPDAKGQFTEPASEAYETAVETPEESLSEPAEAPDIERLELARSAVEDGDWTVVAGEYEALLASGEGLPYLISDLETSVEVHEQQPILKRLLGDAYVRNGQLERAVDVYRQALDQL
jgi:tetratricopeptide (TPR) repeat protein